LTGHQSRHNPITLTPHFYFRRRLTNAEAIKARHSHQVNNKSELRHGSTGAGRGGPHGSSSRTSTHGSNIDEQVDFLAPAYNPPARHACVPPLKGFDKGVEEAPIANGEIRALETTSRTITLSWRAGAAPSQSARIKMRNSGETPTREPHTLLVSASSRNEFKPVAILDPKDGDGELLTYTVTHLKPGRSYKFRVEAGSMHVRVEAIGSFSTPSLPTKLM